MEHRNQNGFHFTIDNLLCLCYSCTCFLWNFYKIYTIYSRFKFIFIKSFQFETGKENIAFLVGMSHYIFVSLVNKYERTTYKIYVDILLLPCTLVYRLHYSSITLYHNYFFNYLTEYWACSFIPKVPSSRIICYQSLESRQLFPSGWSRQAVFLAGTK